MFNLRHIQLIVTLTSKDEKTGKKFHEEQHRLGEFARGGRTTEVENADLLAFIGRNGDCEAVQIGCEKAKEMRPGPSKPVEVAMKRAEGQQVQRAT